MAKPRVFISSTYYDLKHIRSAIEGFIHRYGFEPIMSEKGSIGYVHDQSLDESCYQAASKSDIFVMVVGGRYGAAASDQTSENEDDFFDRYDSITKRELQAAIKADIPVYIFLDAGVSAEYNVFTRNRENTDISYANVDSQNIFHLIDEIYSLKRNNQVFVFERYSEIEDYLKIQWASLFLELLQSRRTEATGREISLELEKLSDMSDTLKFYLENLVSRESSGDELILDQNKKLKKRFLRTAFKASYLWTMLQKEGSSVESDDELLDEIIEIVKLSNDPEKFKIQIDPLKPNLSSVGLSILYGGYDKMMNPTISWALDEARDLIEEYAD
nr:DUF4062 domain-containing protein [uncultured Hyphomonas sp.]